MKDLSPLDIAKFWMLAKEDKTTKLRYTHDKYLGRCWIWQGSFFLSGYGRLGINNKSYRVHRISYYLCYGEISSGNLICHRCDTPACVNPEHLFQGTARDNANDRDKKNRYIDPGKHKKSSSKYHGVHFFDEPENRKKWRVTITYNYKQKRIGRFLTELEAAKAYDKFIRKLNYFIPKHKKKPLNFHELIT